MNKILNRSLFTKPKQEHRSTGITSGLQYRQNYRVGGRVGFKHGGTHINPNLSTGSGIANIDMKGLTNLSKELRSNLTAPDFQQYAVDYSDPKFATDRSSLRPTGFDTISKTIASTLDEFNQPTPERTLGKKSMVNTAVTNFLKTSIDDKATRKKLDALGAEDKAKLAMKAAEQESKLGIASEEAKAVLNSGEVELTSSLYLKQLDALKAKEPNKWDFIQKALQSQGIDYNNPDSWTKANLATIADITAQFTGEKTSATKQFELGLQKNNLYLKAYTSLDDRERRKILEDPAAKALFDAQIDGMLSTDFVVRDDDYKGLEVNELIKSNSDLNILIQATPDKIDLTPQLSTAIDKAYTSGDDALSKQLTIFNQTYRLYLEGKIDERQFQTSIDKINKTLLGALGENYKPISLTPGA